jgi:3-methyladenine DNA glycosylase AlkD
MIEIEKTVKLKGDSMHSYTINLCSFFKEYTDETNAPQMEKYMRNQFSFLGIKAGKRRELFRSFVREHGLPLEENFFLVIHELWEQTEREFQYIALDLLDKRKVFEPEDIENLETLVRTKSWWDTVDWLATKIIGRYFRQFPEHIPAITERWIASENMWLKRSAILFQRGYKEQTDTQRLIHYIKQSLGTNEFFIDKAIGWALREYSKTDAQFVIDFVEEHELSSLSKREALKWLNARKK